MRYIKEHAELVLQEPRLTGCVTMVFVAIGTDEDSILQLLTARSNAQRQLIKASYKTLHGKVRLTKRSQSDGSCNRTRKNINSKPIIYWGHINVHFQSMQKVR